MIHKELDDLNIISERILPTPEDLKNAFPLSASSEKTVLESRELVRNILDRRNPGIFIITGPCSIHDPDAAREYGARLKDLSDKVREKFLLIMRVYFEKPRTVTGWKGFINDPFLDDSFSIEEGLTKARGLLLDLTQMGTPVATEALDPIIPQYLADLITWTAIGARTTESQTHRELASGLSTPVGFKNGTDGNIEVAVNAIRAAGMPHSFLGITQKGECAVMQTRGNRYAHLVLRGGLKPNYDADSIALCEWMLQRAGMRTSFVVDCSHGNSGRDPEKQKTAFRECIRQIRTGNTTSIAGLMLESNIHGGHQEIPDRITDLEYGISITDPCLDWESTEELILEAYHSR